MSQSPKIWVNKAKSFEQADEFNTQFWKSTSPEERFSAAWQMVQEYVLKIRRLGGDQLRLRRTLQKIKRTSD